MEEYGKCLVRGESVGESLVAINERLDEVIKFDFNNNAEFSAIGKFDDKFVEEIDWSRVYVIDEDNYKKAMKRLGEIKYMEKVDDDEWIEKIIKSEEEMENKRK